MATKKKKTVKLDNTLSNRCVPVRFTAAQHARIQAEARKAGIKDTEAVREAVLNFYGIVRVPVKPGPRKAA